MAALRSAATSTACALTTALTADEHAERGGAAGVHHEKSDACGLAAEKATARGEVLHARTAWCSARQGCRNAARVADVYLCVSRTAPRRAVRSAVERY